MTQPDATYRLQLHAEFTLHDAARLVPYLHRLGISHVYLSPIAEARTGSEHGYDVVDPCRVAEALGGAAALETLSHELRAHGMGVLLDIVPNHMAASTENPWWRDLLEHGPASEHVRTFDTPWLEDDSVRLRLPVLGDPLEDVLARGELTIQERDGAHVLAYFDRRFPVPAAARELAARALADHALAGRAVAHDASADHPRAAHDPSAMRALLDALPYELVHWREVNEAVCYRRFFDITHLVGVRVEDPDVFGRTHAGVLQWLRDGWIDALRIDHIDGLRDPERYLEELAAATAEAMAPATAEATAPPTAEAMAAATTAATRPVTSPATAPARGDTRCYTVVEKILAPDERLPSSWKTDGATGYEFTRAVTAFLLDRNGYAQLDALRRAWTGMSADFETFTLEKKRFVLDRLFCAELADVARRVAHAGHLKYEDVHPVMRELTAALSVYRTYITERGVSPEDRQRIESACAVARKTLPPSLHTVLDDVCAVLLLERVHASEAGLAETVDAVARWQQLTGPVMAKGFEDTVLYSWPALLAVNEVGGEPGEALAAQELHAVLQARAEEMPGALNATSTHDTKRSEDVRARLLVLAEHPDAAIELGRRWREHLQTVGANIAARDEIVLLQTLLGVWPIAAQPDQAAAESAADARHALAERIRAYMQKAAREAKVETSWLEPNADYEARLDRIVNHVLLDDASASMRSAIVELVQRIALHGSSNALNQVLLKCTAPGVPDVYQGTESWRFDLVDPDNRRPVDFATLQRQAAELAPLIAAPSPAAVQQLTTAWRDGRIKQYVLMAALACRRRSAAFSGAYRPLSAQGEHARNVLAFERCRGDDRAVVIATRSPGHMAAPDALPLGSAWSDTHIVAPDGVEAWRSVLTGEHIDVVDGRVELRSALAVLPCALLEPE